MRLGIVFALALIVGSVATHFLLEDNGFVLINFRGYVVQMSVPILLLLLVAGYLLVRTLARIWRAPRELGEFAARKRQERTSRQIMRGYIALSEGKMARGERLLTKSASNSDAPLLNYLAAARAAQSQGDSARRDGWLKMAYEQDQSAGNAVLLAQAEMQLDDNDLEKARATLNRIREKTPAHPQALRMLAELYEAESNWRELAELIPTLRSKNIFPAIELDRLCSAAYSALLAEPGLEKAAIESLWSELTRNDRKRLPLIRARAAALVDAGETATAEAEIRKALKRDWDTDLVVLYASLESVDASRQLKQIENWLNARPDDPQLLLAAGRASVRNELWGKARSYIESSIVISPTPEAYHQLGQLMLRLDDSAAATDAFQKGLVLSGAGSPNVPQLGHGN